MSEVIILLSIFWAFAAPLYSLYVGYLRFDAYLVIVAFYLAIMLTGALNDVENNV